MTGYTTINLGDQSARLATPEKALLDLIYLQPGGESMAYLQELRLQNLERLDFDLLKKQAKVFCSPKMDMAVNNISELIIADAGIYEDL